MSTSSHLPMNIVVHWFIRCVNGSGSLQLHHCHGVPGAARSGINGVGGLRESLPARQKRALNVMITPATKGIFYSQKKPT